MSTQSKIDEAVRRNSDELSKELLWIRMNEGLVHRPWDELSDDEKQRIENAYAIILVAMQQSYDLGREGHLMDKLQESIGNLRDTLSE